MSNNLLLAAVIGAAVFMVVKKQGQAAVIKQGTAMTPAQMQAAGLTSGPVQTATVNGDMWQRLLGAGFVSMAGSGSATGLIKNLFGQTSSSDGKPIYGNDPQGNFVPVLVGAPSTGVDYVSDQFPLTGGLFGWGSSTGNDVYNDDFLGIF